MRFIHSADWQLGERFLQFGVKAAALDALAAVPDLPVFILAGNHDPYSGPDCVWERRLFQQRPTNVTVLSRPTACEVGGGFLVASPLQQKVSTVDPSLTIAEL